MQLKDKPFKLLALASHPIQYQTPLFKKISETEKIDLTVLFCSRFGFETYYDKDFKQKVKWDIPLLNGYKYKFLKNSSVAPNPSKFWGLINFEILDFLDRDKYDAIWIHGWNSFTNWLVLMSTNLRRLPVLLRCETNLLNSIPPFKANFKKAVLRNLFKRVSGFLPIGKYNIEFYRVYGVPDEKMFLVPYAVDNEFFFSKEKECRHRKNLAKQIYNIPADVPVILFSGKLTSVKRPMDLLKAFEIVSKELKAALVYVGDGPLFNKLQKYVRENQLKNVFFLGFKNQTELPEMYALADVLVLPSEFEPWGLVVNEAMCFGLPVIVSDQVGAGGDLVKKDENGFVFPARNYVKLAEYLQEFLTNSNKCRLMGKKSIEIITSWSYKQGIEGILNCLESINQ